MIKNWFNHPLLLVAILLLAAYLRFDRLDRLPNGLLPDEAMRGYDAYAILQTGADSFGVPWPLFLRGFDDYTPALYSYLSVPFIALFDLSVFSTRLAATMIGLVTVALTYPLVCRPFGRTAAVISSFLLAISPWHILASRTGTEWNLLVFGSVLTITLAYRGLKRPGWLISAGVAAGIALYGYAPIKAFLPLLGGGFVAFFGSHLYRQKRAALIALLAFMLIALPVYTFSFTPAGMNRFKQVYQGRSTSLLEALPGLVYNYFSYFSPEFLVSASYSSQAGQPPAYTARLRDVGLLYWAELPLMLFGLFHVVTSKRKSAWFMLYWLAVAPLGINLHRESPWPTMGLTLLPIPQALAGGGAAWLWNQVKRPALASRGRRAGRWVSLSLLGALSLGLLGQFGSMAHDLLAEFPVYGAGAWVYGRGSIILGIESLKNQYDSANLATEDLASSIYLLFYTRYDPARRQADLAQQPQQIWQSIGDYHLGNVRDFIQRPGCHLVATSVADAEALKLQFPHLVSLQRIELPTGQPQYGLYALPNPVSPGTTLNAQLGDSIILQGFALATPEAQTPVFHPGRTICLVLQWQALAPVGTDYTVFVHLTGSPHPVTGSEVWAQHDSAPAYGARVTSLWQPGDVIQDPHILTTPPDMPPGRYRLEVGLYNPARGERLPVHLSEGRPASSVTLMTLNLAAPYNLQGGDAE